MFKLTQLVEPLANPIINIEKNFTSMLQSTGIPLPIPSESPTEQVLSMVKSFEASMPELPTPESLLSTLPQLPTPQLTPTQVQAPSTLTQTQTPQPTKSPIVKERLRI